VQSFETYAHRVLSDVFAKHGKGLLAALIDIDDRFQYDLIRAARVGYGFFDKTLIAAGQLIAAGEAVLGLNHPYIAQHVRNMMVSRLIDDEFHEDANDRDVRRYSQLSVLVAPDPNDDEFRVRIIALLNADDLAQRRLRLRVLCDDRSEKKLTRLLHKRRIAKLALQGAPA